VDRAVFRRVDPLSDLLHADLQPLDDVTDHHQRRLDQLPDLQHLLPGRHHLLQQQGRRKTAPRVDQLRPVSLSLKVEKKKRLQKFCLC
jgi:hypothetical protein